MIVSKMFITLDPDWKRRRDSIASPMPAAPVQFEHFTVHWAQRLTTTAPFNREAKRPAERLNVGFSSMDVECHTCRQRYTARAGTQSGDGRFLSMRGGDRVTLICFCGNSEILNFSADRKE